MNIRATSTFSLGNLAAFEERLVPRLIAAVGKSVGVVADEARTIVAVDTGELQASIGTVTNWEGQRVTGSVQATAPHAAFVEFGTGIRGAASPGAGAGITYSPAWPGMRAQPYLRPSLDISHGAILGAFRDEGFR